MVKTEDDKLHVCDNKRMQSENVGEHIAIHQDEESVCNPTQSDQLREHNAIHSEGGDTRQYNLCDKSSMQSENLGIQNYIQQYIWKRIN